MAKEKNPKVSICMCTSDRMRYMQGALQCVLAQTYTDFELVVIDDASSDDTYEWLVGQARNIPKIKVFKQETNNYIDAHNRAIKEAKGEYIAWFDSDDICLDTRIKAQADYLDEHKDVDFVSCTVLLRQNIGLVHSVEYLEDSNVHDLVNEGNNLCTFMHFQSGMFRRSALKKFKKGIYFFPEYATGQCGQGFVQTLYALGCKFANINSTVYLYRVGEAANSMTKNIEPTFSNSINDMSIEERNAKMLELLAKYNGPKKRDVKTESEETVAKPRKTRKTKKDED